MFCFRQSNNLINKVHERALKLIYQDNCNFEVLLEKQHDFLIHQRNLQVLMTEFYKIVNGIAPPITNSLFTFRLNQHNLRNFQELSTEKRNTVNYSLKTVTYRAPVLWEKLPSDYKLAGSLTAFKSKLKSWKCEICTCRLCKSRIYLNNKNKSPSRFSFTDIGITTQCTLRCLPKRSKKGISLE